MRSEIQETIAKYLDVGDKPQSGTEWHYTLTCFVGMIETGEATLDDFLAVGGKSLADSVELRQALSNSTTTKG